MPNKPPNMSRSFSAFSSACDEVGWQQDQTNSRGNPNIEAGRGGANAPPNEVTEVERRVLAHERILQALIGHLADDDPEILIQLKARFGNGDVTPNLHPVAIRASASLLPTWAGEARGCVA